MDVLLKVCNHGCYLGVCIPEPKLCQKPVVPRVIGRPNLKGASNSISKRIVSLKDLVSCTGKSGPGFCPSCMAITLRSFEG